MNEVWSLILGAALAIFGGGLGYEYRARRECSRELESIQVSLCDELTEIESIIKNMHEVWEKSKVVYPSYLTDLQQGTTAFDRLRPRLFLIKDEDLRKKTVAFYKKLKDASKSYEGKVGLADTKQAKNEQAAIETAFNSLGIEAKDIREKLDGI